MRYSPEHKALSHEHILAEAARSFREHGGEGSGIGIVMKRAGLTKGGFYRHFRSKDDLLLAAVARAFEEMGRSMVEAAEAAPPGRALPALIERYLSPRHAEAPGFGCVVAALGPELARKPPAFRKRVEALQAAHRERLLPYVPGRTRADRLATCRLLLPSMTGVLVAARLVSDPQARKEQLAEARAFFSRCFPGE